MQIKTTSYCKYDQIKLKSLTICISDENVEEPELCKWKCKEKKEGRKEGRRVGGEEGNGTTNLGKFGSFLNIHLLNDPGFILRCLVCGGVVITFFLSPHAEIPAKYKSASSFQRWSFISKHANTATKLPPGASLWPPNPLLYFPCWLILCTFLLSSKSEVISSS